MVLGFLFVEGVQFVVSFGCGGFQGELNMVVQQIFVLFFGLVVQVVFSLWQLGFIRLVQWFGLVSQLLIILFILFWLVVMFLLISLLLQLVSLVWLLGVWLLWLRWLKKLLLVIVCECVLVVLLRVVFQVSGWVVVQGLLLYWWVCLWVVLICFRSFCFFVC